MNLTVTNGVGSDSELKSGYITVNPAPVIDEWSITLTGVGSEQLTRANFETLANGNRLTYTDASGTWSGVALWRILARVDDSDPASFSDTAADLGYNVTVKAGDNFSKVMTSSLLKRNDNFIVADSLNGAPLPKLDSGNKQVWPLKIVGSVPTSGQKVGNISQINLSDFVTPPSAPIAGFSADPLSGTAPLTVKFTDASSGTGPLTYTWDFNNDGITDNSTQSPSYTYLNAGTYTVNLTVTNGVGSDSELKSGCITVTPAPVVDTLFDGTVNLAPDTKFTLVPYNNLSASYQVNRTTPLGALDSVNKSTGIRVDVTDSSYGTKNILMVDNVGNYLYSKSAKLTWICQVNGVTLDDFGFPSTDGLNIRSLANGDQVNFYYGMKPVTPS